jgi:GWxTD domain-containing protein
LAILGLALLLGGCAGHAPPLGELPALTNRQRDAAMKALLGKEKFAEFVLLSDTAEANAWLRRFWTEHDPTPTTPKNEFEDDHRRRVYHAIGLFGSNRKSGPPWDERGEVYIRYGDPNERRIMQDGPDEDPMAHAARERRANDVYGEEATGNSLTSRNAVCEVWTYYRWNQSFQFQDKHGWGFFEMVPVTDPTLPRQDLGEFFNARLSATDLQPAIYFHEYGKNQIDYALDVVRFHAGDNLWRVDVNLGYPLSVLCRGGDSVSISLRRTVVIRDDSQKEVYSEVGILSRRIDSSQSSSRLIVEQKICDLPSGKYHLAVTIDDLFGGKTGTYTKTFLLPKYVVSEVHEISDIEMASFVWSIYEPGASFIKGDRMVMPLPSRVYLAGQELAFYYEVYNLLLGENGATHYSVSYQIKNTAGKLQFEFQEPGEFTSTERNVKQFGALDLNKVPPGDYLLTIKVSDRVGQHDRTTVAMFKKSG